jgi:prepilin peptidase CpaA
MTIDMQSIAWWPSVGVLVSAAMIDLRTRRIPNWLSLPFLAAGILVQSVHGGWQGFGISSAGIGLALLLFAVPCWLRLMGMGDLKLALGVGAWIGPGQFVFAFIVTSMVAGAMAACYALRHRALGRSLNNASEMIFGAATGRFRSRRQARLDSPDALSIPYAPAFAIGTLFSFFAQ